MPNFERSNNGEILAGRMAVGEGVGVCVGGIGDGVKDGEGLMVRVIPVLGRTVGSGESKVQAERRSRRVIGIRFIG